jgi:hypothetical protein
MNKPRFKVGDIATYRLDLTDYHFFGDVCPGYQGTVEGITGYIEEKDCYRLRVTHRDGGFYAMLESEFEEYEELGKDKNGVSIIKNVLK